MPEPKIASSPTPEDRSGRIRLLLVLPYLALLFPPLYARNTPALWGIPFFYWYQFLWVLLASAIIGLVFRRTQNFL